MNISTNLPGSKIVLAETYEAPNTTVLPAGLILSVRSLELTLNRKKIKLLAIRNKQIIDKLYEDIPEEAYQHRYKTYSGSEKINSKFYIFQNDLLQHFLDNANYHPADDLYKMITELPK